MAETRTEKTRWVLFQTLDGKEIIITKKHIARLARAMIGLLGWKRINRGTDYASVARAGAAAARFQEKHPEVTRIQVAYPTNVGIK